MQPIIKKMVIFHNGWAQVGELQVRIEQRRVEVRENDKSRLQQHTASILPKDNR